MFVRGYVRMNLGACVWLICVRKHVEVRVYVCMFECRVYLSLLLGLLGSRGMPVSQLIAVKEACFKVSRQVGRVWQGC